jgi:hypothetical protein
MNIMTVVANPNPKSFCHAILQRFDAGLIIPIGDSLLVTPKTLNLEDARRELRKLLKSSGATLKDLIAGLDEAQDRVYAESYGKKKA